MAESIFNAMSTIMSGATDLLPGKNGGVPAPLAGDQDKYLKGDGTWSEVDTGNSKLVVVDLDDVTNTSGSYSHTTNITGVTADMKALKLDIGTPSVFKSNIQVETGNGTITLTCADVVGSSTVKVSLMFEASISNITSTEFDILSTRITNATAPMTGATSSSDGAGGTVPAPSTGDEGKVLMGNGTWETLPAPALFRILDKTVSSGTSDFSSANYLSSDVAVLQLTIYGSTVRASNMFMLQDVFDGKGMQVNLAISGSSTTYQGELVKKDSTTFTLKMNAKDDAWVGAVRLCIYRITYA